MSTSATQRTIRALKSQGRKCAIVEKWNPHVNIRQDLFRIIDILALDPERGVIGIQTGTQRASHFRKITEDEAQNTIDWLETPGTVLELYTWRKVKVKRGGKAVRWEPRIEEIIYDGNEFKAIARSK